MQSLKDHFPNSAHDVLPVIHVETLDQALRNAAIARRLGCDGVFLINHHIRSPQFLPIVRGVLDEFPGWWVGVNCLDLEPEETVARVDPRVAGIWADNAKIDEHSPTQAGAERFVQDRTEQKWNGLYFGGVAFKYQKPVADPELAAKIAVNYIDVVTTSGPGTGKAAATEKIAAMRRGLGEAPLAIASGITPENVGDYLDLANCFLVATGISDIFTELDPRKVTALIEAVRQWTMERSPGSE